MAIEIKLPELGENIHNAQIIKVMVSPGDPVEQNQAVLEVETDKAAVEIPSPAAGRIGQVTVKEGDRVNVGELIFTLEQVSEMKSPKVSQEKPVKAPEAPQTLKAAENVKPLTSVTGQEHESRRAREAQGVAVASAPVLQLARQLGVNIGEVRGTGAGGQVTMQDVRSYPAHGGAAVAAAPAYQPELEREPMDQIRRITAERMAEAWANVPHVTLFEKADVTELERFRQAHKNEVEKAGGHLSMTVPLVKIVAMALQKFRRVNASLDMEKREIVYRASVNVGVAVDTGRGLLVPVIKDVDKKDIRQISVELVQLADKARQSRLNLAEMQGGSFTITNLGSLGTDAFSPIVNSPEVAILGVGRAQTEAWYDGGVWKPRLRLPLSLSFDHRMIDGADAAKFLNWIVLMIEQPFSVLLNG